MRNSLNIQDCRAISFDGDMTLWNFDKVMRHSLAKVLAYLQENHPNAAKKLTVETMIDLRNEVAESCKGYVTNLEEIRFRAFVRTLDYAGYKNTELAAQLNSIYLTHRFEDIELYNDVKNVLGALSQARPCGLVSNGNSYPERCGLANIFSFVVFSQDIGVEKPNPAIFEAALEQVSCQASQLVHVGDSLESDVAGANTVGAVSVWLNREGVENATSIVPDFEINTLDELLEIIPATTEAEASSNAIR